jgi:hypothetical protein
VQINGLGFSVLLHYIQSSADVTMAINTCNLLQSKNDIKTVTLLWQPEPVIYYRAGRSKDVAVFRYKGSVAIF